MSFIWRKKRTLRKTTVKIMGDRGRETVGEFALSRELNFSQRNRRSSVWVNAVARLQPSVQNKVLFLCMPSLQSLLCWVHYVNEGQVLKAEGACCGARLPPLVLCRCHGHAALFQPLALAHLKASQTSISVVSLALVKFIYKYLLLPFAQQDIHQPGYTH